MTCFLGNDDELIFDRSAVTSNCLQHLIAVSGEVEPLNATDADDLPPLTLQETSLLQSLCSSGKAITRDAFSDTWFQTT
jgi:hypothetical protein